MILFYRIGKGEMLCVYFVICLLACFFRICSFLILFSSFYLSQNCWVAASTSKSSILLWSTASCWSLFYFLPFEQQCQVLWFTRSQSFSQLPTQGRTFSFWMWPYVCLVDLSFSSPLFPTMFTDFFDLLWVGSKEVFSGLRCLFVCLYVL